MNQPRTEPWSGESQSANAATASFPRGPDPSSIHMAATAPSPSRTRTTVHTSENAKGPPRTTPYRIDTNLRTGPERGALFQGPLTASSDSSDADDTQATSAQDEAFGGTMGRNKAARSPTARWSAISPVTWISASGQFRQATSTYGTDSRDYAPEYEEAPSLPRPKSRNPLRSKSSTALRSPEATKQAPRDVAMTTPDSDPGPTPFHRVHLHIRQQPRAARAGPDGKDRRTIDPPPVLQLLLDDFKQGADTHLLNAPDWVVYTKLIASEEPHKEIHTIANITGTGHDKKQACDRVLIGAHVANTFFCEDDPDPSTAPRHPVTKKSPPPSPTARFIPQSANSQKSGQDSEEYKRYPGAFFIFSDMSVRKAGQYRLLFELMKIETGARKPGSMLPVISSAMSDVFNVVNAKDFDQVQPSTELIRGLLQRGAPYPLKLKKGLREGQKRKAANERPTDGSDDDDQHLEHSGDDSDDER